MAKKMKHINFKEIEAEKCTEEGVKATKIRWLITEKDGAENFAMRLFEVKSGGHTPWHKHDWEHEIFILEGNGVAKSEKGEEEFKPGDVIFVPPMERHQLKNSGKDLLKFLCLIPYKK
jgi:quercetin dioxygenase-like cupin family protein